MLATAVGFELQLHPTPPEGILNTLTAVFPLPEAVSAMSWYSEWAATAPFELQSAFTVVTTPTGPAAVVAATNFDPDNTTAVNEALQVSCCMLMEDDNKHISSLSPGLYHCVLRSVSWIYVVITHLLS